MKSSTILRSPTISNSLAQKNAKAETDGLDCIKTMNQKTIISETFSTSKWGKFFFY